MSDRDQPTVHDLVIAGGRVIDPQTHLDAVRDVGVTRGRITSISDGPLIGRRTITATRMVVAPGFIDLHSHGQTIAERRLQALDGVTTALELEAGTTDIDGTYRRIADEGMPINFGYSASWSAVRAQVMFGASDNPLDAWRMPADAAQTTRILGAIEDEIDSGAIGIGILLGYAPATDPAEYLQLAALAATADVPTFTHARPLVEQDPTVPVDGAEELARAAGETGAHMHFCHVSATSGRQLSRVQGLISRVSSEGARITTEAYPYGAAMTTIGADYFDPRRLHILGETGTPADVIYARTGEVPASAARLDELRTQDPGGWAFLKLFTESPARISDIIGLPGAVIASDAMPLIAEPGTPFDPEQWPLPHTVRMHPRGAGSFARTLRVGVRETGTLSLSEAVAKCSLLPAQTIEAAAPDMRRKGRIQIGCDADLVVFDPATVTDNATYTASTRPSSGFAHVLVRGESVVARGELLVDARPGRGIRGRR